MHAITRSPRLWLRFSLRTLLALVTFCGGLLGWQLHLIHQRAELRQWLVFRDALVLTEKGKFSVSPPAIADCGEIPWYRRQLGDKGIYRIFLKGNVPAADAARVRRSFPEAEVSHPQRAMPLSDSQYSVIKRKIEVQAELRDTLRKQFIAGVTLPEADLTAVTSWPVAPGTELADFAPALANKLEDEALLGYGLETMTIDAAVHWLRTAESLRQEFGSSRKIADDKSQAETLHAVNLELLRLQMQLGNLSIGPMELREYQELLVDYEIVSLQDQPSSGSEFSPAERRWHAATLMADRLCEAAQAARESALIDQAALVGSWQCRFEARLAAADLTDSNAARKTAWQQYADAVRDQQKIVESLYKQEQPGGEAEKLYVLRDCAAAAEVASAHLDRDEAAEASALERRVESSRLLVEAAKAALDAETITVGEYIDAVGRSIEAHDRLATLRPLAVDAQSWREQLAQTLNHLALNIIGSCGGSQTGWGTFAACQYLLVRLHASPQASP